MEWPSNILPSPRVDLNFSGTPNTVTNKMETGATRQRRRFLTKQKQFNVQWTLDNRQLGLFDAFIEHKLDGGASKFLIDLPSFQDTTLEPTLVPTEVVLLNGTYESSAVAGQRKWAITAVLVADNYELYSEDVLDIIISEGWDTSAFEQAAQNVYDEASHMDAQHPFN